MEQAGLVQLDVKDIRMKLLVRSPIIRYMEPYEIMTTPSPKQWNILHLSVIFIDQRTVDGEVDNSSECLFFSSLYRCCRV